jgi:hypothetical protein
MYNKLVDVHKVQLTKEYSNEEKVALLDSANSYVNGAKKGLIITFDLSSSFKKTNNRLYSVKGQMEGALSWTHPYPKPILKNHDKYSEPIGRIVSVEWVPNDAEIAGFFSSKEDLIAFKRILDTDDPKKIVREMNRRGLLENERWPGVGKLVAKARISDQDAIEKFLDSRYLTFSAGSDTDKYRCGICGKDWAANQTCNHYPGEIDEDEGIPAVFLTGSFFGREASVVSTPANGFSQLISMQFSDSQELPEEKRKLFSLSDTINCSDAFIENEEDMSLKLDISEVVKQLLENEDFKALVKPVTAVTEEVTPVTESLDKEVEVDWYLLGLGLKASLKEKRLDEEQLSKVPEELYCDSEKLFVIANADYAEAAKALIEKAKLSDAQKEKVSALIVSKIEVLDTLNKPCNCGCAALREELANLQKDYQSALESATSLQDELKKLKEESKLLDTDSMAGENDEKTTVQNIKPVEDVSVSSSQRDASDRKGLGDFEKEVVSKYIVIRDSQGKAAADLFLAKKKYQGYLSKSFNINLYTQENE